MTLFLSNDYERSLTAGGLSIISRGNFLSSTTEEETEIEHDGNDNKHTLSKSRITTNSAMYILVSIELTIVRCADHTTSVLYGVCSTMTVII